MCNQGQSNRLGAVVNKTINFPSPSSIASYAFGFSKKIRNINYSRIIFKNSPRLLGHRSNKIILSNVSYIKKKAQPVYAPGWQRI